MRRENAEAERRGDAERIENLLSEKVFDAAIDVNRTLGGRGLLENLLESLLEICTLSCASCASLPLRFFSSSVFPVAKQVAAL